MAMVFCKGCGKEIHETATACPQCGAPQVTNNNQISNDAKLMLLVEYRKKSGWIAALLNWIIPGAGYMYCGRTFLGIAALLFIVAAYMTIGLLAMVFTPFLIIDGFLSARRYNKQLIVEHFGKTA
ncbi:MAG: hypothetical protein U1C96_10265 [Gallionella sp.]|nr:hypothetical protein [Gallionella sp.]